MRCLLRRREEERGAKRVDRVSKPNISCVSHSLVVKVFVVQYGDLTSCIGSVDSLGTIVDGTFFPHSLFSSVEAYITMTKADMQSNKFVHHSLPNSQVYPLYLTISSPLPLPHVVPAIEKWYE